MNDAILSQQAAGPVRRTKKTPAPTWPWGWIIDAEHFIDLLRQVFGAHEGHVWLFNYDLALFENRQYFEELYSKYIRGNPRILSVRVVLSQKRLHQFKTEPVYKWRFTGLSDEDIKKFQFRTLEEVQQTHSDSKAFAEFYSTFVATQDAKRENVLVFYAVSGRVATGETVTIFRPNIYPFVALDENGNSYQRALAGQTSNWTSVASNCSLAIEDVFMLESAFSHLHVKRRQNQDIEEFVFDPPLSDSPSGASAGSGWRQKDEVLRLAEWLRNSEHLRLADYAVIGSYVRYDEAARNSLHSTVDDIRVVLLGEDKWKAKNNFLIWAPSKTGKTEFVSEMAKDLVGPFATKHTIRVEYVERKLSALDETKLREFTREVQSLLAVTGTRVIAFLDEVDKQLPNTWPFDAMLEPLDSNAKQGLPVIWVLAGSTGNSEQEFKSRFLSVNGGDDFINRTRTECVIIPRLTAHDRAVIACSYLLKKRPEISEIERAALLFLAGKEDSVSGVVERAERALHRLDRGRTWLHLHHCVSPESDADIRFQAQYGSALESLSCQKLGGPIRCSPPVS